MTDLEQFPAALALTLPIPRLGKHCLRDAVMTWSAAQAVKNHRFRQYCHYPINTAYRHSLCPSTYGTTGRKFCYIITSSCAAGRSSGSRSLTPRSDERGTGKETSDRQSRIKVEGLNFLNNFPSETDVQRQKYKTISPTLAKASV